MTGSPRSGYVAIVPASPCLLLSPRVTGVYPGPSIPSSIAISPGPMLHAPSSLPQPKKKKGFPTAGIQTDQVSVPACLPATTPRTAVPTGINEQTCYPGGSKGKGEKRKKHTRAHIHSQHCYVVAAARKTSFSDSLSSSTPLCPAPGITYSVHSFHPSNSNPSHSLEYACSAKLVFHFARARIG
jgi:hypothetical protein